MFRARKWAWHLCFYAINGGVAMSQRDGVASLLRKLMIVWSDFESRLNSTPVIERALNTGFRAEEYLLLLSDHYHQVKEGSGWISRAASSISEPYLEQRSAFISHAVTEHRDYEMLERGYVASGGAIEELKTRQKNIGSEALSSWMYYQASQSNPFNILGAMFVIESLGKCFAQQFVSCLKKSDCLNDEQLEFYIYHAEHDETHIDELENILGSGILSIEGMADSIVKTAKVTARLYLLQLEELGNY